MVQSLERSMAELIELTEHGSAVAPEASFHALLLNGGTFEMNVDGSADDVEFEWANPLEAGREAHLEGVHLAVIGNAIEDVDGFFAIAAIDTGLLMQVVDIDGVVLLDFNSGMAPFKRHAEFSTITGVGSTSDTSGGKSRFSVDIEFEEVAGHALLMQPGSRFCLTVRDDLRVLTMFRGSAHGHY